MNDLQFKPLSEKDVDLLYHWFQEPIINQWYARGKNWSRKAIKQKYLPRILGKENIPSFIIYKNNRSLGFIQYYYLSEHFPEGVNDFDNPLFKKYNPAQWVGIDLLLAHAEDRGNGLGQSIINRFILKFLMRFKAVIVDPDTHNNQAIRCYEKAGFTRENYSENPKHLILIKDLADK